jgi:hypothetical protein
MVTSHSRRRKTIYSYPNESTLLSLIHSESTIVGAVGEQVQELKDVGRLPHSGSSLVFSDSQSKIRLEECKTAPLDEANEETDSQETSIVESVHASTLSQHDLMPHLKNCDERMVQGCTIVAGSNKTVHIEGFLELHLQPPECSSPGVNPQTFE